MEQSLIYIAFGAILGTFISSISIVAFIFLKKKTIDQSQLEKECVMRSIGELCAEIDSLMLSNRDGILKNSGIQNAIRKKHDDIVMLLNKNMHMLDAYFVRYIDSLQKSYLNVLTGDGKEVDSTSQNSILFSIDKNAEPSELDIKIQKSSIAPSPRTGSVEHDLQVFENAFFKESSENEASKTAQETAKEETASEKTVEISEEKPAEKITPEADIKKEDQAKSDSPSEPKQAPTEEEFTMETIMDLDVSKITKAGMKKTDLFSIKKEEPVEEASFEQTSPTSEVVESEPKNEAIESEQSESSEPVFENDLKSSSESPSATPAPTPTPSAKVAESTDSPDITGDDVAEKIDEFFGFSGKK